jgi:hypothetical protein
LSDRALQIVLYLVIFGDLLFGVVWLVSWLLLPSRRSSLPAKLLWRDIAWIVGGGVGWYIFSKHVLDNMTVFIITFLILGLFTFVIELVYRRRARPRTNSAT